MGEPDAKHHIVSVSQGTFFAYVYKGAKPAFAKTVQQGTTSLMEAGVRPRAIHHGPWGVLHLYLPVPLLSGVAAEAGKEMSAVELIDPACTFDQEIECIGREVISEMKGNLPLLKLRIDVLGQDVAIQLLRRWSNLAGTRAPPRAATDVGLAPWQLRRACDRMADDLADEPSLAELASTVGLSPEHFCRAFRQSTGLPPHRWLAVRRIEEAQTLLLDLSLSLTDVAQMVGYAGQSAFGAAFRRATGWTPRAWRRDRLSRANLTSWPT